MHLRHILECVFLAGVVLSCWLGVLGMVRMREPMQALQYLVLPATAGATFLALAVFTAAGNTPASRKTLAIALMLLASNAAITHATARAFRTRQLGHWEPCPGDPIEFVPTEIHQ
jgi:multisubunit Na+/H+ antiporter MnhG subunit